MFSCLFSSSFWSTFVFDKNRFRSSKRGCAVAALFLLCFCILLQFAAELQLRCCSFLQVAAVLLLRCFRLLQIAAASRPSLICTAFSVCPTPDWLQRPHLALEAGAPRPPEWLQDSLYQMFSSSSNKQKEEGFSNVNAHDAILTLAKGGQR